MMKALAVTINPNIPGVTPVSSSSPGAFISNFYQFALLIAGILALGAIVYGGVKYAASAGNPSAQSEGKEWILSALYGLILLAGAYIILYTINPNLVQLNLPTLAPVAPGSITLPSPPSGGGVVSCGGATCASNQVCSQNTSGGYSCVPSGGVPINPNPACKGVASGCTIYILNKPTPSACNGQGVRWNSCANGAPNASAISCYNVINC